MRLKGALVGIDDEDDSTFTVTVDNKTFHFQAKDSEERERWIRALEDTVLRHNQLARRAASQGLRKAGQPVRMEDFERKLAETDCYLQLLIDQNQSLVEQLEAEGAEEEEGAECRVVVDRVTDMVETVKHAIVLLQIAKNASCPVEGEGAVARGVGGQGGEEEGGARSEAEEGAEDVLETCSVGSAREPASPAMARTAAQKQLSANLKNPSTIPAVSYSSSDDDEDDFFDAQDDVSSRGATAGGGEGPTLAEEAEVSPLTPSEVDWDALYDQDEDEAELDMKNNGSVITHLLSQVRDCLESRPWFNALSCLLKLRCAGAYRDGPDEDRAADLHPGAALAPRDVRRLLRPPHHLHRHRHQADPRGEDGAGEAPLARPRPNPHLHLHHQVLKWYLSSFSASRKGNNAKKPYNPIIGASPPLNYGTS